MQSKKKTLVFLIKNLFFFFKNHRPKNWFLMFFFYNLKKGKYISLLWSAYSGIHIIYCIIQAVKHYMNCIYIDSDSNNFMFLLVKFKSLQSNI